MVGREGLERLERSRVVVVGLGAVGSYATEALARAGVGHLRLVDFDEVRLSNINRQLHALHSTLGRSKVLVARERILDINPDCQVEALRLFVHRETLDQVLAGPPDLVIDAIDSLTPKVELLAAVQTRCIPVVSSMGAALRTDPQSIRVGPLAQTRICPLAAKIRKALRRRGVSLDLPCVYSVEPLMHLPPGAIDLDGAANEDCLVRGRRRRALGSLPTLTGMFGLAAANKALEILLGGWCPG